MPFEFLGGDLQTEEGRSDFVAYGLALDVAGASQVEDIHEVIVKLSEESPEDAAKLLQQLFDEYEERWEEPIRRYSGSIISSLTKSNTALMAETLSGLLKKPEDSEVKRTAKMRLVEEDVLAEDISQEEIGLRSLAKISRAYLGAHVARELES